MKRIIVLSIIAILGLLTFSSVEAADVITADECLSRSSITVKTGTDTQRWRQASFPDHHAIDARTYTNLSYPFSSAYPVSLGDAGKPIDLCILGGKTIGQQSEGLTWNDVHDTWHGGGFRVYGADYVVNGWRIRNTADGFQPRDGENWVLQNNYYEYIRDDCIENDDRLGGIVYDSLFDGCYTGLSEQDAGEVAGESLIFDGVLMRLQAMPGPYGSNDPNILGHGSFFKKFDDGGRHQPIIRNSIFVAESFYRDPKDWPQGTTMENVTVVWLGEGEFPMSVLPGMTLTTNRAVWDTARAEWLARHGCTNFGTCSNALYNPNGDTTPTPTVAPSPTVSPTPTVVPSPTVSPTPTVTPTPTATPSPTVAPSPTVSPTPPPKSAEEVLQEVVACFDTTKPLRCIRTVLRTNGYM